MKTKMYAIRHASRRLPAAPIERPCLICQRAEVSRLHGLEPPPGAPGVLWWEGRPVFDGHYYHAYDPGERRQRARRRLEPPDRGERANP